jgi:hypothetical protein
VMIWKLLLLLLVATIQSKEETNGRVNGSSN